MGIKKTKPIPTKEIKKYLEQELVYDCQSLDLAFVKWLYSHLCKFADIVPIEYSKLSYTIKGDKTPLSACVNRMILLCKKCFREFETNGFSSKYYDLENELFEMWSMVRYDLWYY